MGKAYLAWSTGQVKICASPQPSVPRGLPVSAGRNPQTPDQQPPTPPEPPDNELGETIFRWVGKGAQGIAMVPNVLQNQPWIAEKLNLQAAAGSIRFGAGIAGAVSTLAMGTAGALEVRDGITHRNLAEVLAGGSEIARAGFVGSWTTGLLADQRTLLAGSEGLSVLSGALQTGAGLARLAHKKKPGSDVNPKIVGLLEAGMGASWVASTVGVPAIACMVVRMGLSTAKALYTNQEKWHVWTDWDSKGKT